MPTYSLIGIQTEKGTIRSIYCHWNGYLSWNGKILLDQYATSERVNALIDLGHIYSLRSKLQPDKKLDHSSFYFVIGLVEHGPDTPHFDTTVTYHRDIGEPLRIDEFPNEAVYYLSEYDSPYSSFPAIEYRYLFKDGIWHVNGHILTHKMLKMPSAPKIRLTSKLIGNRTEHYLKPDGAGEDILPSGTDLPDFSAYYFPETRRLFVYAGTEEILRHTVNEDEQDDYWHGFQYGGAEYDVNLSRPGEDSQFCLSIYPVQNGQTQTGRSLPVTFSERKSPFHVGDKVRFTEEAIALVVGSFGSDEVSEFMTQVYRESEYVVEDISASPEYDHNIVTVRHSAEDDSQGIAEYNLMKKL